LTVSKGVHAGRARSAAGVGALAALAVAGGYCLAGVPNVEVMTLIIFASGWLTGLGGGAAAGVIGMFIYTMANPYGAAVPLLAAAQILCFGLVGASGGIWGRFSGGHRWGVTPVFLGLIGAAITLVYDLTTNIAIGISFSQVIPTLVAGIPFSLIHVLANALVFALGGPYLFRGLAAAGLAPAGRVFS
jgi:hypothetical protein